MAVVSENIAELALELGRAMNEMKSRLRQQIRSKISEYDPELSFELLEIIGLLWRKDGINQQEIAEIVSKDKSSVTYLINSLVKRGLVKRVENKNDRRNKQVFLTPKGRQIRKIIFPWVLDLYQQAAGDTGSDQIRNAIALLKKMTTNLG
ncbi:MAG: MarR family transcriptional regulator [Sphingobacteriales bacterium]|nr:MarR family transcriptional regulator [Sphingobacteriales bacterium]OJY87535.1 MAG: MarR family transcriptional regulator [Sphingobacteriales bacterium 44-15]